jgi:hypothetical protein
VYTVSASWAGLDGHVGDQDQIVVQVRVVCDKGPKQLLCFREPDFEPTQGHLHAPHFAGVGEGYTEFQRQWHRSGQIIQQLRFPTVHPLVLELAPAIMARSEDELAVGQVHLLEDLLIIQSCIAYEAQFKVWEQSAADPYGPVDLTILAHKVSRHIGEPIGIRHYR